MGSHCVTRRVLTWPPPIAEKISGMLILRIRAFSPPPELFGLYVVYGRRGGLMVSALDSRSNGPGSSPSRGHCVVFLGKTLYSHSASLHPGV